MRLIKAWDSMWKSVRSSGCLVLEFTGPGEVLAQSLDPDEMINYLFTNWPGKRYGPVSLRRGD